MPALAGAAGDRDLPPEQGGELREQAGLVALDREHVMRAAPGQIVGVGALGMHRIRGDDRTGDVNPVQQYREHRDLVRLRAHVHLAQNGAVGVVEGS